jgi:hypothetical protein
MLIKELFLQYEKSLNERRENRRLSYELIKKNRMIKEKYKKIKKKLIDEIIKEIGKGKTLYQICKENFNAVDQRFHNLYIMIMNEMGNEQKKSIS